MIVGQFKDDFPRVLLSLRGERESASVEFIVDTAFNGALTLPMNVLRHLGATLEGEQRCRYADGSVKRATAYSVEAEWTEGDQRVEVLAQETNPLLGTEMLKACLITIEATEGGEVVIETL